MSSSYQRTRTYFEAVQQAAHSRDLESNTGSVRFKSDNPSMGTKTSKFDLCFGANWKRCENPDCNDRISCILDYSITKIRAVVSGRSNQSKNHCTCAAESRDFTYLYRGEGIESARENWESLYKEVNRVKIGSGKELQPLLEKEWIAFFILNSAVYELAQKKREIIRALSNNNGTGMVDEQEEQECKGLTEEEEEQLLRHGEDINTREYVNQTVQDMYCWAHRRWGDLLPTRGVDRYESCGICVKPIEETPAMRKRREEDAAKISKTYEVRQYEQELSLVAEPPRGVRKREYKEEDEEGDQQMN